MAENGKDDIRKITGAVEDAVTYPILTRDVTSPPSDATGVSGPSRGASLDSIAQSTIRQLLGWRYRADDTTGFLAALTKTIQLKEVEGHIEWNVQPQSYMVQADLGEVTGAQASIYARAQVALDQSLPLLNGLTLLGVPTADVEDMEAIRAIIQTELTALVNELGMVGGPRVQRIDSFFSQLLGPPTVASIPPAASEDSTIQLVILAYRFGLTRTNVNTIDDEQDFTNYLILYDYIYSFYQTWQNQRIYFTGKGRPEGGQYLGTQLVLISQALDALEESVQEAYDAMDSVFFGASDRQATELHLHAQPLITVAELFSWVEDFATNEGLQLIQEAGKDGVVAFRTTINQLEYLIFLAMTESRAHSRNPVHGFHTARVQRAMESIEKYLRVTENEADKIERLNAAPPPALLSITPSSVTSTALAGKGLPLTVNGVNILAPVNIWLISRDTPNFGIQGTSPTVNPLTPDTQTVTATFAYTGSELAFGKYIVVVQNPDGQYGWLENAIMVIPDSVGRAPMASVPGVVGKTLTEAIKAIRAAKLEVGTLTDNNDATIPAGHVIGHNPVAGSSAAPGSAVDLVVSLGPPAPMASVPGVVGKTLTEAIKAIRAAKLEVGTLTDNKDATIPAGHVISHNLVAGSSVAPGSAVDLVISSGPRSAPDVTKMTEADATKTITGAGLKVGAPTRAHSAEVAAGSVISQDPPSGPPVDEGSAVDLVISSGPRSAPDVTKMTEADATKTITGAGLKVGALTRAHSAEVAAGSVISQDPPSGPPVDEGSAVDLVISSGPHKQKKIK